jgi:hypothetical protein
MQVAILLCRKQTAAPKVLSLVKRMRRTGSAGGQNWLPKPPEPAAMRANEETNSQQPGSQSEPEDNPG